ncbi:MAG: flagellar hook-associated protein FlgK [Rhodocyclaceae bacterium]|nr:flagellar hook-associated protein FlgK [Rhodocyclaceae bacterium]
MASLLNIGITGLNAAQAGLVTTGHNISNAATPGYSRQSVVQSTQDPIFSGAGFFGTGTRIESVKRSYSQYLENQVLAADTRRAELETYTAQVGELDNLLADADAGLSAAMEQFFQGVQDVAANPSNVPARQSLLSSAESLVSRFQTLAARVDQIRDSTETLIAGSVDQINTYAREIADLNVQITSVQAAGSSLPANDLLDQRNELIRQLNQYVRVSTVEEASGAVSVFIGTGQSLVIGGQVSVLSASASPDDPQRLAIALETPSGGRVIFPEGVLSGGQLSGALSFRRETLDPVQNQLGLIAAGLGLAFNEQHRLGMDLDGAFGGDFFEGLSPTVKGVDGAASPVTVAFDAAGAANLTGDEYLLTVDTSATPAYTLTRRSDGQAVNAADVGLTVTLGAAASLVDGDQFLIQPTRNSARDLAVAIQDTRLVAAADPVVGNTTLANAGTGNLSEVHTVVLGNMDGLPADNKPDFNDIVMTFNSASNTLTPAATGLSFIPATLSFNPATDAAGKTFTLAANRSGVAFEVEFKISGVPSNGDTFTLSANSSASDIGVSDNRNMVALGELQFNKSLLVRRDGSGTPVAGTATATFQSVYSQLVSTVGSKTREVQVGVQAQERLMEQASASKEALSGVNLDEEAANLVRYQQSYQASARVMQIAGRLFDEILSIAQ